MTMTTIQRRLIELKKIVDNETFMDNFFRWSYVCNRTVPNFRDKYQHLLTPQEAQVLELAQSTAQANVIGFASIPKRPARSQTVDRLWPQKTVPVVHGSNARYFW